MVDDSLPCELSNQSIYGHGSIEDIEGGKEGGIYHKSNSNDTRSKQI